MNGVGSYMNCSEVVAAGVEDMLHARLKTPNCPIWELFVTIVTNTDVFHFWQTPLEEWVRIIYRGNNQKLIVDGHYFHACLANRRMPLRVYLNLLKISDSFFSNFVGFLFEPLFQGTCGKFRLQKPPQEQPQLFIIFCNFLQKLLNSVFSLYIYWGIWEVGNQ